MRSPWDIPVRAISAAIVVVIVTSISTSIGSFASGMFAVFPIVMACSAVILHLRVGGRVSASMFAHAQIALNGLARLSRHALSGRAGRRLAGLRARPVRVHRLERRAVGGAQAQPP